MLRQLDCELNMRPLKSQGFILNWENLAHFYHIFLSLHRDIVGRTTERPMDASSGIELIPGGK
jgi:hypothetical protein